MSGNLSQLHSLLGRFQALRQRVDDPGEKLLKEVNRCQPTQELLRDLSQEMALLGEELKGLGPALTASRLAEVSTRMAVHFFVEKSMPRFCEHVLDEVIQLVGAGTGAVILFGENPSEVQVVAARDAAKHSLSHEKLRVSRTILNRIADGQDSVLVEDALADALLRREESVRDLSLRSVMAIPLRVRDYLAGAIHLENEGTGGAFGEEELDLLRGVGRLAAIYLNALLRLDEEVTARRRIYDEVKGRTHFDGIVGSSPNFIQLLETVAQVGPSEATVVIEGENGTGKELIARALHRSSKRAGKPMVVVNCAAIPESLVESELFGHEKGAFTGAFDRKLGRFEQADGSTLFMDEIGELSVSVQAKLLRFLQSREFSRLGSTKTIKVDLRLIAATNRDIQSMVKRGEFREDLFYRLYVVPLPVPPLRERAMDLPLLIDHFCRVFALQSGREAPEIETDVYEALQSYGWPGNVRELEYLMQRLVVLCRGGRIRSRDLPDNIQQVRRSTFEIEKNPFRKYLEHVPASYDEFQRERRQMMRIAADYTQRFQDQFIDTILEKAGGNISRAAEDAGIHRTLIHRNLSARGLRRDA